MIPGAYGSRRQSYAVPNSRRGSLALPGSRVGSLTSRPSFASRQASSTSAAGPAQEKARERAALANREMASEKTETV